MMKKLFIAIAVSVGLVAAPGAPNLSFAPDAQAFGLKDVGKGIKKGVKKTGKAVKKGAKKTGKAAKKVGKGTKNYFDKNVSVREFGRSWKRVGKGAWRGTKKGLKKTGRAIRDTAKCAARGGCGSIGRPPGPQVRDHRRPQIRDHR